MPNRYIMYSSIQYCIAYECFREEGEVGAEESEEEIEVDEKVSNYDVETSEQSEECPVDDRNICVLVS